MLEEWDLVPVWIRKTLLTPDASAYVYTYNRSLSELYMVDGLR